MGQTALIPAWVAPSPREVTDCHWLAHAGAERNGPASRHAAVLRVMDWVADKDPDMREAQAALRASHAVPGAYDTLSWLLGMAAVPPIRLVRRNPDGTLVTEDQLYGEYMAGKTGLPEQRAEARAWARTEAARNQRLADLAPH